MHVMLTMAGPMASRIRTRCDVAGPETSMVRGSLMYAIAAMFIARGILPGVLP